MTRIESKLACSGNYISIDYVSRRFFFFFWHITYVVGKCLWHITYVAGQETFLPNKFGVRKCIFSTKSAVT
jgi:hypothetical protein